MGPWCKMYPGIRNYAISACPHTKQWYLLENTLPPPPPPYTMLKIRENSGWAPPTLFVALFREIGLGMRDFKNVHILKWRLNKTFRGNVKWWMWVDVASKGSNDIFRLFHSLMEKDYPACYIQWNLSLGHLHSEDTKFGTGTMCVSFWRDTSI